LTTLLVSITACFYILGRLTIAHWTFFIEKKNKMFSIIVFVNRILGNADRHHYETFVKGGDDAMVLHLDNGKRLNIYHNTYYFG
jgi:hypothetical protein